MKKTKLKVAVFLLGLTLTTVSCDNESINEVETTTEAQSFKDLEPISTQKSQVELESENYGDIFERAVEESPCGPTVFAQVQNKYIIDLVNDPLALSYYSLYTGINQRYARFLDVSEQYFGADGDYTKLMVKRERELESFWDMENEIQVQGQHTATLNDRDALATTLSEFYFSGGQPIPLDLAYVIADSFIAENALSPNLPENLFFAADGFATGARTIVIGDGLVSLLAETGISEDIVWTGILAHEWAHQVQFKNYGEWYPEGAAKDPAESTRYTELEADFLASYYMTHKRGATYNWKRVEGFYELFFQIGDCGFDNPGHHGTPAQRYRAARLGFEVAQSAQKQGFILTQDEAHEIFTENINSLL